MRNINPFKLLLMWMAITMAFSSIAADLELEYNPMPDAPTHETLFEELFGIEKEDMTPSEIFRNGTPPDLLGPILLALWFLAVMAFIAIFMMELLKSTINAPKSKGLLGEGVNTPFAPLRMALAFFFLMCVPDGKHYSVIESIVISANKYASSWANELFVTTTQHLVSEDSTLIYRNAVFDVSDVEAMNAFKVMLCVSYASKNLGDKVSQRSVSDRGDSSGVMGLTFDYRSSAFWIFGGDKIDGACGSVGNKYPWPVVGQSSYTMGPDLVPTQEFEEGVVSPQLQIELQRHVTTMNITTFQKLVGPLRVLADELIAGEEIDDQDLLDRFNRIITDFKLEATIQLRSKLSSPNLITMLADDKEGALQDAVRNGWLYAGNMPFTIASVHDKYLAFRGVRVYSVPPSSDFFETVSADNLSGVMARMDRVIGGSKAGVNAGATYVNKDNRDDLDVSCWFNFYDCIGAMLIKETMFITDGLRDVNRNPLVFTHAVGAAGAQNAIDTQLKINVGYIAMKSAAASAGDVPFFGSGFGEGLSVLADIMKSSADWSLKYKMFTYGLLGYYVPLMIMIYFLVAVVSYIIMLFVSVLGANFFAVGHAWLEGNGLVSSYAQRGYPSLLFSAISPILIIGALFIYLLALPFVFKMFAWVFQMGITPMVKTSSPTFMGGVIIFTTMIAMIMALHRILAKLTIDIPDRVMRLIGVHESLAANDFSGQVESGSKQDAQKISDGTYDSVGSTASGSGGIADNHRKEGDRDRKSEQQEAARAQKHADGQPERDQAKAEDSAAQDKRTNDAADRVIIGLGGTPPPPPPSSTSAGGGDGPPPPPGGGSVEQSKPTDQSVTDSLNSAEQMRGEANKVSDTSTSAGVSGAGVSGAGVSGAGVSGAGSTGTGSSGTGSEPIDRIDKPSDEEIKESNDKVNKMSDASEHESDSQLNEGDSQLNEGGASENGGEDNSSTMSDASEHESNSQLNEGGASENGGGSTSTPNVASKSDEKPDTLTPNEKDNEKP